MGRSFISVNQNHKEKIDKFECIKTPKTAKMKNWGKYLSMCGRKKLLLMNKEPLQINDEKSNQLGR